MPIQSQSQVGPQSQGDGSTPILRSGREADLIVSELAGKYGEATRRGEVFTLSLAATTTGVAAGNITGAAAAASTNFALWNPPSSGKYLELLKLWIGVISGTPPGGPILHNTGVGVPSIAGVPGTNCLLGGPGSVGRGVASAGGTTLTGGPALNFFRAGALTFSASAFADAAGTQALEVLDGDIVIPPGYLWVPCWAAAGTTLLNAYAVTWRETPI
jgi:hypothetical protein